MRIGVSTACFYPTYTEKAVDEIIASGINTIEIFFNSDSELCDEFTDKLKSKLELKNCNVTSIHPFTSGFEPYLIFSQYERRFNDALNYYLNYFKIANKLGAKIVVLHGDLVNKMINITDKLYFERYRELSRCAQRYGVYLAQENVNLYKSQSPDFIRSMSKCLGDDVRFVFDIKQSVRAGVDPFDMCESMGDKIVHIHVNDHSKYKDCLLPGEGQMDYKKLKKVLDGFRYSGDMVIEVYRNDFQNVKQINDSINFLKEIF